METVDLNKLSPAQLSELKKQVAEQERMSKENIRLERETYKTLVDETVKSLIPNLQGISFSLVAEKAKVFKSFETILEMKQALYNIRPDQQSHTFTTSDGTLSITIGHRVNKNFDDSVTAGIQKVRDYLKTLAKDDNSALLVETIMDLLKKDSKGNLKADNIPLLSKKARESGNDDFIDGIQIIEDSIRHERSCLFVTAEIKDLTGVKRSLPLSMSSAE
jgi:hypothetical protein